MTAINLEIVQTLIRENITGKLDKAEKPLVLEAYTKTTNVFLRDRPLHIRAELAKELLNQTSDWVAWETPAYAGGRLLKMPFGKDQIEKPRGANEPATLMHEAIHYLQNRGELPFNYALTYATTRLVELEEELEPFIGRNNKGRVLTREDCSTEEYLNAILENRAHEYLVAPFVLRPDLEKESDKYLTSLRTYLANEERFNLMFSHRGEVDLPEFMGVSSPYSTMQSIGSARGNRAYALGYFTGNIDSAWTVLWLHSQGMKFEEAEKMVARAYLDGTIGDFNNYSRLRAEDVERVVATQEVFKTRKLNPLELERVEQEAGVCAIGKIRNLLLEAGHKASIIFDAVKATVRNIREMGPQELQQAREVYSNWTGNHFYRDSLTGKTALDITELRPYLTTLATESYNADAEYAGNIFVFPDQAGYPQAKVLGTRKGFAMSSLAEQYSKRFPENIGTAHAHYYAEYSGHSIRDLVEFVTHQGHFLSVVASMNGVYVLAKTPDFDDKTQGVKRHALGAKLLREYADNQATRQPINELEFVRQRAKELGLAIFQLEGVNQLTESEALVLSEVD